MKNGLGQVHNFMSPLSGKLSCAKKAALAMFEAFLYFDCQRID